MKTRFAALAITAAMTVSVLTGCGSGNLNSDDVVAEFGDTKIKAGVAEFYARYQQASYETYYMRYYGEDMWTKEVSDGNTYEDSVKDNALDTLKTMYVLETHMDEYQVEFTDEDEAAVEKAAQAFVDANDEEALSASAGDLENVKEVLKLITIQRKMYNAMIEDADTDVSDEEAAQKSMNYVFFSFETKDDSGNKTTLSDDEKVTLKETAMNFQTEVAEGTKTFEECAEEAGVEAQTENQMRTGFIHVAISVGSKEQVDKLTETLKQDGYTVTSGPRTTGDGYYESCVVAVEENLIEITV